jgi:hypothetical protein
LLLPLLSFIGNLYNIPLISPMGILYYQGLDIMLTIVGQCHVQHFMTLPQKTNNVSFKGLEIYYHQYHSSSNRISFNTGVYVFLDFHN